MTRDQWLSACAQRLIDRGGMDPGEAAAFAGELARQQKADNGLAPAGWDRPVDAADEEMACWSD